jgi:hypothetical protein
MERGRRKKIDAVDLFVGGVMREVWWLAELRGNLSLSSLSNGTPTRG